MDNSLNDTLGEIRNALSQKVKQKNESKAEADKIEQLGHFAALVDNAADRLIESIANIQITVPDITVPEVKIPDIKVNVPDIKAPEVVVNVPEIKIPEIKLPLINVPTPEVTVNIPKKDMDETNKILKALLKKQSENDSIDVSVTLKLV